MASICLAVLTPGQMGASFGNLIRQTAPQVRLVTAVSNRSSRTRRLAETSGFEDLPLSTLLSQADIILSVLGPS